MGQALEDGLHPQVHWKLKISTLLVLLRPVEHELKQELARYSGDHGADWQVAGVAIRSTSS